jgi:hypothetical protein
MFHGSIPWEVSQLSHLQLLDLAENNLTDSIPASLSNFTYFETMLDIYARDQSGDRTYMLNRMAHSYDGHTQVDWKGRYYTFNTEISLMIGIDLSSNSLFGEIPSELMNLEALRFLNLSRNKFSGPIPVSIGNLKDVESIDLSWNKLSGPIPSSISHLKFLSSLNVFNNLLSGEIPTGNQLQTFDDPYIYSNNLGLCGVPLSTPCKNDSTSTTALGGAKEDHHQLETLWLYYSVIAGNCIWSLVMVWRIVFWEVLEVCLLWLH